MTTMRTSRVHGASRTGTVRTISKPRERTRRRGGGSWRIAQAALLLLLCGCARKAPGPDECHAFATGVVGRVRAERPDSRLAAAVEELTVHCLTTPYDRELIACARQTRELEACFAGFRARHPDRAARSLPRRQR
jgi:hypothetical protein